MARLPSGDSFSARGVGPESDGLAKSRSSVSGSVAGYRLILDKQPLGDADAGQQILPRPGVHMLTLVDPGGRMIDRVRFTVR